MRESKARWPCRLRRLTPRCVPHGATSLLYRASSWVPSSCVDCLERAKVHATVMQAPPPRFAYQPNIGLQRSNSAPDLRILLSGPLNPIPQIALQGGMNPLVGSSSTAGALVPYKAPEVCCNLLP